MADFGGKRGERLHLSAGSLDDLLRPTYQALLDFGDPITSTRGSSLELRGASLELREPRARLSRSRRRGRALSALGEFVWYLAGSAHLEHIEHYIPGYGVEVGARHASTGSYGPRLFGPDGQFDRVVEMLSSKLSSRQAVIQIFDRADLESNPADVPCTCTLQFFVRGGALELHVHMRSNDAFIGLPHDVFAFTMLQELAARQLNVELGPYLHSVGSLHLYEKHRPGVDAYMAEGLFEPQLMPAMPTENVLGQRQKLIEVEAALRARTHGPEPLQDGYWGDLARVLFVQRIAKGEFGKDSARVSRELRAALHDDGYYGVYISDLQYRTAREELGETSV